MFSFTETSKFEIFVRLFEILPQYAKITSSLYVGVIIRRDDDLSLDQKNIIRNTILKNIIDYLNVLFDKITKAHFILHLHRFGFDTTWPAIEFYRMEFKEWTLDIGPDDVLHVEPGKIMDQFLSAAYTNKCRGS